MCGCKELLVSHVKGQTLSLCCLLPSPALGARWGLTSALRLLAGRAFVTWSTLAEACVSHQNGFTIVLARSAAAGVEFQQVIVQSPFQILPFGFHVAKVASAENFMDGLQLRKMEMNSMETISAGHQPRCCHTAVREL